MTEFQIHYLSECPQCGGDITDPFIDNLCFECDHSRHSVAPWDAPNCSLCWPDEAEDDWYFGDDEGGHLVSTRMLKYRISAEQEQTTVPMRTGAVIRAIGVQSPREVCLWAEVPDSNTVIARTFRVIGTGFDVPKPGTYIGTAFDGPYVWHVYEVAS